MTKDELIAKLHALKPVLEAEGVTHVSLFGSRARGDQTPESDIDLHLDVAPGEPFSLLDLIGVEHIVEDTIGLKANAVMGRSLDGRFRKSVENDAVAIF